MNKSSLLPRALVVAVLLALPTVQAAALSKADYRSDKTRLDAQYKTDKAACAAFTDNAKDVCVEQAKAKEKVARAELEFAYTGTNKDRNKVQVARAESAYAVAKEKCDDQTGNAKDVCVKEAKAVEVKALGDAAVGRKVQSAMSDAAKDTNEAQYKVAAEKCDSMATEAKAACMDSAKAAAGKN
ncbi:MAG: hypothetical protein ACKVQR_10840 [Aquabacterium sp.]